MVISALYLTAASCAPLDIATKNGLPRVGTVKPILSFLPVEAVPEVALVSCVPLVAVSVPLEQADIRTNRTAERIIINDFDFFKSYTPNL
ncbi:hypothetical protein D3C81_1121900 [compost metagenome]